MLRVVDAVGRGETPGDSTVELKADWPDPSRAARRIAGHANAARGQEILWIIGLDESRGVVERQSIDLAEWWPQVVSRFDEVAPTMSDLVVHTGKEATVVALCFETDRAPYVVKATGGVDREVPWRDGTRVRTAKRSDLIRVLVPAQASPTLQIVSAKLHVYPRKTQSEDKVLWRLSATLYFTARQGAYVVFPDRLVQVQLEPDGLNTWLPTEINLTATKPQKFPTSAGVGGVQTVLNGVDQLIVEGHGYAWVTAHGDIPAINGRPEDHGAHRVEATITLHGVDLPGPVIAVADLISANVSEANWGSSTLLAFWRTADATEE